MISISKMPSRQKCQVHTPRPHFKMWKNLRGSSNTIIVNINITATLGSTVLCGTFEPLFSRTANTQEA